MKFIDLKRQYHQIKNDINNDIVNICENSDFVLGQKVFDLERTLSDYVGVKHCVTCASGTDALIISLMAYNIGFNDAVFTTNFSYFATTEAISLVGANPIFVDIESETYNISPELLEIEIKKVIKENKFIPKAIIAVDLFGQLADYDKLQKIADKYNLILIEDAAQSFGARFKEKKSCSFGHIAATSFYPAKPFGAYGDGGAIFTNDSKIDQLCRSIRVHGQGIDKYDNVRIGLNSRLDTIQAAILLRKFKIFNDELVMRNELSDFYNTNLDSIVKTPNIKNDYFSSWAQYSILLDNESQRDALVNFLSARNIPTAIFYKKIFSELEIYSKNYLNRKFPISKAVSKKILSLPMHPYIKESERSEITKQIQCFINK